MPPKKTLRLIIGDQLDEMHSWLKKPDRSMIDIIMEIRHDDRWGRSHSEHIYDNRYRFLLEPVA